MQIHILEEAGQELAAIDNAVRRRELEIRRAQAVKPIERLYMFAGWTLDETTRDLISPTGQRVDLTSSEFDLLMAFLRHPGQPLSRAALLGVLRGREWTYFDRSIDTMVARLRKKLDDGSDRPPLIRSVRGVGYVFCAAVGRLGDQDRSVGRFAPAPKDAAGLLSLTLSRLGRPSPIGRIGGSVKLATQWSAPSSSARRRLSRQSD